MRRLAAVLGLAVALAAAAPGRAAEDMAGPQLSIQFAAFAPARVDVLAGDTATWHNAGGRAHTVSALDGSWSSPRLTGGDMFAHRFDTPGVYRYYCQLHPFMQGEVDVQRLLLAAPTEAAAPGRPFVLSGRAALAAGGTVAIQRDGAQVATATVGDDGGFAATVVPRTSGSYTAVAGSDSSAPVQLLVLDRKVTAAGARHGRRWSVAVHVAPASAGARVVLQLRLRERFGWWPVRSGRLDRASNARFLVRPRTRVAARVVLTLRDGATVLATSRTLHVETRR